MALGVTGLITLNSTNSALKTTYENRLVRIGYLQKICVLLIKNQLNVAKNLAGDPAAADKEMDEVEKTVKDIDAIWNTYTGTPLTKEEKKLADQFIEHQQRFMLEGMQIGIMAIRVQNIGKATDIVYGPMTKLFEPVQNSINELIRLQADLSKAEYEQSQKRYLTVRNVFLFSLTVGLLIGTGVALRLIRSITASLNQAVTVARSVAAGDLTQAIEKHRDDETGQLLDALEEMNASLSKVVSEVHTSTDSISLISDDFSRSNANLSMRTADQAKSLEETSAAMKKLTLIVQQNSDDASRANALTISASEVARKGGSVVSEVISTMDSIDKSAKTIVSIVDIIDGIAFQTNILALNAAVEAARAGDGGRGFAVVASEVRNLAQRSATAAKEIKFLINDSTGKIATGVRLVDLAGDTINELIDSVSRVTDIMNAIAETKAEQDSDIEMVGHAVKRMDQVTQKNNTLVKEVTEAASKLRDQADHISKLVSVFKLEKTSGVAQPALTVADNEKTDRSNIALTSSAPTSIARTRRDYGKDWGEKEAGEQPYKIY